MLDDEQSFGELDGRTPGMYNLLAAFFNYDWDLDYPDVEAVYVDAFDDLCHESRLEYFEQAKILQTTLADDDVVERYLRHVGTGFSPTRDTGMAPKQWLDALVARLERG